MAGFVVGGQAFFLLVEHAAAPLAPPPDLVAGLFKVPVFNGVLILARGEQGGFVDEVCQVGAGEAGRAAGNASEVDRRVHFHFRGVNFEDFRPALQHGQVDDYSVEAARAQQGRVEDVRPVGCGYDDDRPGEAVISTAAR